MTLDDVTFVYKKNIFSDDKNFVSSFNFPKELSFSSLNDFLNDVYKLNLIKKNLSFIDTSSSSELSSLLVDVLKKEVDLKNYIDSSIDDLSYMPSKNWAKKNISLLSYFHHAANVISYDSQGIKSLEKSVLDSASKHFSSRKVKSDLYFLGDSVVVNQENPVVKKYKPVFYHNSARKRLFFAASFMLLGSFLTFYAQKKFPDQFLKQNTKNEVYQSKKRNHKYTKPVAKYKNHNISK